MATEPSGVWPAAGWDQVQVTIRRAIADPNVYVPRGDNYREPLPAWQARAVLVALARAGMAVTFGQVAREYRLDTGAGTHRPLANHDDAAGMVDYPDGDRAPATVLTDLGRAVAGQRRT